MAFLLHRTSLFRALLRPRAYSQAVQQPIPPAANPQNTPYFVPRNSNGNLPVYTDIRNNGTRYLISIRNVDGQAHALARDLRVSLFKSPNSKAARAKVEVHHGKDVIISGGRYKNEVIGWLKAQGF